MVLNETFRPISVRANLPRLIRDAVVDHGARHRAMCTVNVMKTVPLAVANIDHSHAHSLSICML